MDSLPTATPNFVSDLPTYFPVHSDLKVNTDFANIQLLGEIDGRLLTIKSNAEAYLAYVCANAHLLQDQNCRLFLETQLEAFAKLLLAKYKLQSLQQTLKNAHRDLVDSRRHEQDLNLDNYHEYREKTKPNFADSIISELDQTEETGFDALLQADALFQFLQSASFVIQNPEDPLPDDQKDDEVAVAGGKISLKDPLSLNYFSNPVGSRKCTHVYEKEHIVRLLEGHSLIFCPVTGCSAKITAKDLREDKLMALRVKVYLAQKKEHSSAIRI